VQIKSPKDFKVSTEREKKFRKKFETMEGLCQVMPVTDLKSPNTGKDDDDEDAKIICVGQYL
jgi:hypothetical protein